MESSWCKSSPANAVAGRPVASLAPASGDRRGEALTARERAARIQLRNLILVADADVVSLTEGCITRAARRGSREPPESLARGTLSEGFPTNVGDLLASAVTGGTAWSRETEDRRDGRGGVLETRSTCDGGELAQPEPTGGKGWTSGRPDSGIHGDTPRSNTHVHRTESVI